MLKYDLLESQSWSRCPPTCVGQGVAPNSNLPGASLILYLNLLTHIYSAAKTTFVNGAHSLLGVLIRYLPRARARTMAIFETLGILF